MTLLSTRLPSGDRSDGCPIIEPDTTRGAVQLPSAPRPIRQRPPHTPVVVLLDSEPQPVREPKQKREKGAGGRPRSRTPEELAAMVRRYQAGEDVVAVARAFTASEDTVRAAIRAAGVPFRSRRRRGPFTDEQAQRLRTLYASGLSIAECAVTLGASRKQVERALVTLGVPRRPGNDEPVWEVPAMECGCTLTCEKQGVRWAYDREHGWHDPAEGHEHLRPRSAGHNVPWSPQRVEQLRAMYADGASLRTCGEALGISEKAVLDAMRRNGIPTRPRSGSS